MVLSIPWRGGCLLCAGRASRRFSVSDPYLILYARVDNVDLDITLTTELTDPSGTVVFSQRFVLTPIVGSRTMFTIAMVLPLGAAGGSLPDKLRTFRVIVPAGAPARERLGEWTWRVGLTPGASSMVRFTLKP